MYGIIKSSKGKEVQNVLDRIYKIAVIAASIATVSKFILEMLK